MVNIGVLGAFRGPKDQFLVKYYISGRKLVLWTPESPQKAYIDHPKQFDHIF